jgi:seryl-tRNA synthetase
VIQTYNGEQLQQLKSDKLLLIQQINEIEFSIDYDVFDEQVEDMMQAYEYVTKLTQQGKELQLQIAHIDTQIKALQDTEALQLANQKSKIETLNIQIKQLDEQIMMKQQKLDISRTFHCSKIDASCPFIDQISA